MDAPRKKNRAAQQLGSLGGKARARNLTAEALSKIGRDAARKRWRAAKKGQTQ